jgi:hypothetical protein
LYVWYITPAEAGTITGTGLNAEVTWSAGFSGPVQITVVAMNDCGIGEFSDAYATQAYTSSGLEEYAGQIRLQAYPNPAGEVLSVKGSGLSEGGEYSILFFDISGKPLLEVPGVNNDETIRINTETLNPGIYNLVLKDNGKIKTSKKIILKK